MKPFLDIEVPGTPRGQGSMRIVHGKALHASHILEHRSFVALAISEAWAYDPLDEPLDVALKFTFIRPKNHFGTGRNADHLKPSAPEFMAVMPDGDKLTRLALDACTMAGLWRDDCLVTRIRATKTWATHGTAPSTRIAIWPAGQGWE